MDNLKIYNEIFCEVFEIEEDELGESLVYQSIELWDSVGHMALIAELEERFNIELEMDDVIDFSSYAEGKRRLLKYGIEL